MRNHPHVLAKSHALQVGYDDAEDLVRGAARKGDPAAQKAVAEIDAARGRDKLAAAKLSAQMAQRLGLSAEQARELVGRLADSPEAETWLQRRVNLARADGRVPDDDSHPTNE